jgi:hypothetical protein
MRLRHLAQSSEAPRAELGRFFAACSSDAPLPLVASRLVPPEVEVEGDEVMVAAGGGGVGWGKGR